MIASRRMVTRISRRFLTTLLQAERQYPRAERPAQQMVPHVLLYSLDTKEADFLGAIFMGERLALSCRSIRCRISDSYGVEV